jgi:hypothetical protein
VLALALLLPSGCYEGLHGGNGNTLGGDAGSATEGEPDSGSGTTDGDGSEPPGNADQIGPTGLRRLTSREYDATLRDLLLDETAQSNLLLPEDPRTPFDNAYAGQDPSAALIEGAELLAADAAARLVADEGKRAQVVGCEPAGPDDAECFATFVRAFGRRAFRRPLTADEEAALVMLQADAIERNDFWVGVESVVTTVLQSPSFLYRVEVGTPVDGDPSLRRLDGYEMATRLSYFLWGTMPDDELLDAAEAGALGSADGVRETGLRMLEDPLAVQLVDRFHALWMGYENLPHDYELAFAMKTETTALIERVIFEEQRPWQDLLRIDETWVDAMLAEHYGLPAPEDPAGGWVKWNDPGRKGLLGQGSFLSLGAKFGDTSPTQRGLIIRTRLFCQDIPPPPPDQDVNVDEPPGDPDACKAERYAAHQVQGTSCNGCHELVDGIGFGLERYDQAGLYREHDPGRPECPIEGVGDLTGIGQFRGPAGLADRMIESGELNRCVATMLYRFAIGRYEMEDLDENFLDAVLERTGDGDFRFDELLLDFIGSDMFRFRRVEEG